MTPTPAISVVIPARNRAGYILESIESVFAQTFKDYEIVIIDDGSTDETKKVLAPLIEDRRIRYAFQEHKGVSAARNHGVRLAHAPYIAFLDSDDLFLPTKLEKQMAVFEQNPDLGFVHCSFSKFDDQGNDLGMRDTTRFQGRLYPHILLEWSVLMAMPCILVKTAVMKEVGGFDESIPWAEDLDLWRRIARHYSIGVVPESLVKVRVHAASASYSRGGGARWFENYMEKAFAEDPGLSPRFKRYALARMHEKLGQNLLGEGGAAEMRQARQHSLKALAAWPFQAGALVTLFSSFLPREVRHGFAAWLRRLRYPKMSSE
ncbi:MAG: glycosyltransferase family A protein [Anaerolineales bacterium]